MIGSEGQDSPRLMIDLRFRWGCLAPTGHHFDVSHPHPCWLNSVPGDLFLRNAFATFHTQLFCTHKHTLRSSCIEGKIREDENLFKEKLNDSEMDVNKLPRWAQTCLVFHWSGWLSQCTWFKPTRRMKKQTAYRAILNNSIHQCCTPGWITKSNFMHRTILEHPWMQTQIFDCWQMDPDGVWSMQRSGVTVRHRNEFFQSSNPKFVFAFEEGAYLIYWVIPSLPI